MINIKDIHVGTWPPCDPDHYNLVEDMIYNGQYPAVDVVKTDIHPGFKYHLMRGITQIRILKKFGVLAVLAKVWTKDEVHREFEKYA